MPRDSAPPPPAGLTVAARRRVRARVEGTVQGVGFRPYVYRLVGELALAGFVGNDERGVLLEVEGDPGAVDALLARLPVEAPPLARVQRVMVDELAPTGERDFHIASSVRAGEPAAAVSPDTATCADCLAELFDPGDRRHRYPFVNCTNCGPRFTIVRGVPYDRPLTTMAGFAMCARCRAEYEDPADRRFHAQPNACPDCGPALELLDGSGAIRSGDPLAGASALLRDGAILAAKGLGGYHLACLAGDEQAVATLRARKHREDRPFALMAADLDAALELVELADVERALLLGRERPIVLAPRRAQAPVAEAVAPGSRELGVMLPYSPLHHLLLDDVGATLVMTSGNVSDEPIAYRDADALARLAAIADAVLRNDRPIRTRTDDSVLRAVALGSRRAPLMLRRSRGYVPESLDLPVGAGAGLLACGAELKSTFCVAKGDRAWVGHHIGDLKNHDTLVSFAEGVEHFERLFAVTPTVVAHDLHPDYLSTRYALGREDVAQVAVQHHHAHLAACLAEHGETGPAVGAIYDGAGLGEDGTVWGGELLVGGIAGCVRGGHLGPACLPGGDAAARQPWRMACAWLLEAGEPVAEPPATMRDAVEPARWRAVAQLARTGVAAPRTTSMGRLFDAVAALCGIRAEVSYEGQAAIELEAAADHDVRDAYELPLIHNEAGALVLDARPVVTAVLADVTAGASPGAVASRFHRAVATATADACVALASEAATETVVLSGGVFQNRLLLELTAAALTDAGLRVLVPQQLPPNDGGISFGQAAVAAAQLAVAG